MKRSIDRKIQELEEIHPSEEDQEELISLFNSANLSNNKLFINVLTVLYVISIFVLLHSPQVKHNLYFNFISVVEIVLSIATLRYDNHVSRYVDVRLLQMLNVLLALVVSYSVYNTEWVNIVYTLPVIATATSLVFHLWIKDLNASIEDLQSLKFKLKSA